MIPGRKVDADRARQRDRPAARSPVSIRCPARSRPTRSRSTTTPRSGSTRSRRRSWPISRPASLLHGGDFLHLGVRRPRAGLPRRARLRNPTRLVWEAAAAVPFTAFCAAALIRNATAAEACGYRVMGLPGIAPERLPRLLVPAQAEPRANAAGVAAVSTERVDVVIVGSGFGGSITAWRLAELYRAAGVDPRRSSCSSAAAATATPTSASRWTSTTCPTSTC